MSTPFLATEPTTPSVPTMTGSATSRGRASWSGLLKLSLVTIPVKARASEVMVSCP